MKHLTAAALLFSGAMLASQSAFGSAIANDLYLGFQNGTNVSADYIINLGAASSIVTGSSVVDLSSDFSTANFNAVLGTSSSVQGGVVGVYQTSLSSPPPDLYATQLRSALGTPSVPGSTAPGLMSKSIINQSASPVLGSLSGPAAGTGALDTGKSWQSVVEPGTASSSFLGSCGVNPDTAVAPSGVVYEDLWFVADGSLTAVTNWTYMGYFTLNPAGSPKLTFTPTNAPATLVPPVITSVGKAAATVTLVWNTVAGYTYQLQYTTNLTQASWNNIGGAPVASAALMTNSDSSATNVSRFYRVMAH